MRHTRQLDRGKETYMNRLWAVKLTKHEKIYIYKLTLYGESKVVKFVFFKL